MLLVTLAQNAASMQVGNRGLEMLGMFKMSECVSTVTYLPIMWQNQLVAM